MSIRSLIILFLFIPYNLLNLIDTIKSRDESDINRKISPLKAAKDAFLIKTDNLSITQSFEKVMEIIRSKE